MPYSISAPSTVSEGAATITFTITRSGSFPAETIYASTVHGSSNGYATNNSDYVGVLNQAVSFSAGQASRTVTVSIIDDATVETNETFGFIVQRNTWDPASTFLDKRNWTIIDNDAPQSTSYNISPSATTVVEAAQMTFTITRDGDRPSETLYFSTGYGDARFNDGDYALPGGGRPENVPVSFSNGQSSATVTLDILDDGVADSGENFLAVAERLAGSGYTELARSSLVTINDVAAPELVTLSLLAPIGTGYDVVVTQEPGAPSHQGDLYHAWDFALAGVPTLGVPVTAVADGRVVFVHAGVPDGGAFSQDTSPRDPSLGPAGGLGNVVTLEHTVGGTTFYSSYLHLRDTALIDDLEAQWLASQSGRPDVFVSAGDVIGAIGNTGYREGTHLHLNLGSEFGDFVNSAGNSFPAYQIAKGPVDDPILDLIHFADSPRADGSLAAADRFISGGTVVFEDGTENAIPEISGESTIWFAASEQRTVDTMIEVTDPNGVGDLSFVRFWDATPGSDGGFFSLDGERMTDSFLDVAPTQLSRVTYEAGGRAGSNAVIIEAFDKSGASSGDFAMEFIVDAPDDISRGPSIRDIGSSVVGAGSTTSLGSLFRASDPDGVGDLQSFRLLDDRGTVGGFSLNDDPLGPDSGWLDYSSFSAVSYVTRPFLGHDAVTLQVRDSAGNEARSDRVLETNQIGAVDSSERLTFKQVAPNDPTLFSETDWAALNESGADLLKSFVDSLAVLGNWEVDRLLENGIDITSDIDVQTYVANSGSFSVSDIAQLKYNTDLLTGLQAFASYNRAGIEILNGDDPNSALYSAHRDVVLGFASGIAGKVATVGAAKGLVAAGLIGGGAPVVLIAAGGVAVAVGASWALNRYFPDTPDELVDVVSSAPRNFMDLFLDATPFFSGGGGDHSADSVDLPAFDAHDTWTLDIDDGTHVPLAEVRPELATLTEQRLGFDGAVPEVGFEFMADTSGQGLADALIGSRAGDTLTGGAGNDVILGVDGNNHIDGNAGNDTLIGGAGNDTMTGGPGRDVFVHRGGEDTIKDFDPLIETLVVPVEGLTQDDIDTAIAAVRDTVNGALVNFGGSSVLFEGLSAEDVTEIDAQSDFSFDIDLALMLSDRGSMHLDGAVVTFEPDDGGGPVASMLNTGMPGAYALTLPVDSQGRLEGSRDYDPSADPTIGVPDALDALRLAVGLDPGFGAPSALDFIAADINRDGSVSVDDALDILRFAVGLPTPNSPEWVFLDEGQDLSDVSRASVDYETGIDTGLLNAHSSLEMTGILLGSVREYV